MQYILHLSDILLKGFITLKNYRNKINLILSMTHESMDFSNKVRQLLMRVFLTSRNRLTRTKAKSGIKMIDFYIFILCSVN